MLVFFIRPMGDSTLLNVTSAISTSTVGGFYFVTSLSICASGRVESEKIPETGVGTNRSEICEYSKLLHTRLPITAHIIALQPFNGTEIFDAIYVLYCCFFV